MTIKRKFSLTFILLSVAPVIIFGVVSFARYSVVIKARGLEDVRLLAESIESELLEYLNSKKGRVIDFASDGLIRQETARLSGLGSLRDELTASRTLNTHLTVNKLSLDSDLRVLHILDLEGRIIASTHEKCLGEDAAKKQPYFLNGRTKTYMQDSLLNGECSDNRYVLAIATPIKNLVNNKVIGVLMAGYNQDNLIEVLSGARAKRMGAKTSELNPFGKDMDIFMVNKDGLLLTPVKGLKDFKPVKDKVETKPASRCLEASQEINEAWTNLKGVPVWGASMCLQPEEDWKWTLVVEQAETEAMGPILHMKILLTVTGVALIFCAGLVALLVANSILPPLKALRKGAEKIGSGDLDYRLDSVATDELGQLAGAFDSMAHNLKTLTISRDSLEREITERVRIEEKLKEAEARYRMLFQQSPDGIMLINVGTGNILEFNEAAHTQLSYSRDEFQGLGIADIEASETQEETRAHMSRILREGRDDFETLHRTKDGSLRNIFITVKLIELKGKTVFHAIMRDVTEIRQAGERLKLALEEVSRSNRELEQFAYVASHDLQEPLRMVGSYVQLLARRYKGRLDSDADDFIAYAVDGAARMQAMINDLLNYSRIGRQGELFVKVDFTKALEAALANLKAVIDENSAELTCDPLPVLLADPLQITQLFQNLISNAIRYRSKTIPKIHISAVQEPGQWLFSVKDNGIGLDPQYKERIFMIFQRLHGREDYPGTGIGLAICKKIVERHGGNIWVESVPGQGAVFFFTITEKIKGA